MNDIGNLFNIKALSLFALFSPSRFLAFLFACLFSWTIVSFISESEVSQSCPTLCDPVDCSPPGSSIPGILQARILEWVAISFSRGSSQPRGLTQVSRIAGRCFNFWATREVSYFSPTLISEIVKPFWPSWLNPVMVLSLGQARTRAGTSPHQANVDDLSVTPVDHERYLSFIVSEILSSLHLWESKGSFLLCPDVA